jgi:cysteine synthase
MLAYGAELIEVTQQQGMEGARDLALQMQAEGKGFVLNQFGNPDNVEAHYLTTGPEIWKQTGGKITHFVSSMGTTGTIMGVSKYLKEQNPDIQIVGLQPLMVRALQGFVVGRKNIFQLFLIVVVLIELLIFHKSKQKKPCVS